VNPGCEVGVAVGDGDDVAVGSLFPFPLPHAAKETAATPLANSSNQGFLRREESIRVSPENES
jgi:hypothetical protein